MHIWGGETSADAGSEHIYHPALVLSTMLSFRISTFWGRWLRMTTSFLRSEKKIKEQYKFAKNKKKLGHCTWNTTRLEGDEAVDEKCREDTEQLSGSQSSFDLDQFKLVSGAWLPTQWTAALFQSSPSLSSRKSAGETRDWRQAWTISSDGRAILLQRRLSSWPMFRSRIINFVVTSLQDSVFQLFQRVENKHGWMLVVSYLVVANFHFSSLSLSWFEFTILNLRSVMLWHMSLPQRVASQSLRLRTSFLLMTRWK